MKIKINKSLLESFISLSFLNGLNVLLPLITLPYILRVIGPDKYGIYSYIYAIVQYVLLIGNYGFSFSATKQISQNRNDIKQISLIYNSVICARLLLTLGGIVLFFLFSPLLLHTSEAYLIFILGLGIPLGDIFIPIWLFQGMEKMRYLTLVNFVSKILFTILIFVIIRSPKDFVYIILLNSLGYIISGLLSTFIVYKTFSLRFFLPSWAQIKYQIKDGGAIFASTVSMDLYRNSNIFILGLFVSDTSVGLYSAAEKVVKGIQGLISPISQALFPHLSYKFRGGTLCDNIIHLTNIAKKFSGLLVILVIGTIIFAHSISDLLCGADFVECVPLIRIMSGVILFGGMNYLLGIVGLINLNKQQLFFRFVVISGVASVLFLLVFVSHLGIYAAAYSMLFTEILLFVNCTSYLHRLYKNNCLKY